MRVRFVSSVVASKRLLHVVVVIGRCKGGDLIAAAHSAVMVISKLPAVLKGPADALAAALEGRLMRTTDTTKGPAILKEP